jgi:hypothetical protein
MISPKGKIFLKVFYIGVLVMGLVATKANAAIQVVTTTTVARIDTLKGSLPYLVKVAASGDTIVFNTNDSNRTYIGNNKYINTSPDTIITVVNEIVINKDLTILGTNIANGRKMVLDADRLRLLRITRGRVKNFQYHTLGYVWHG